MSGSLILSDEILEKRQFSMYACRLSLLSALFLISTANFVVESDHLYPLQFALHWRIDKIMMKSIDLFHRDPSEALRKGKSASFYIYSGIYSLIVV